MNDRIRTILDKIVQVEKELHDELKIHEKQLKYRFEGARIKFDKVIHEAHIKLRVNVYK